MNANPPPLHRPVHPARPVSPDLPGLDTSYKCDGTARCVKLPRPLCRGQCQFHLMTLHCTGRGVGKGVGSIGLFATPCKTQV